MIAKGLRAALFAAAFAVTVAANPAMAGSTGARQLAESANGAELISRDRAAAAARSATGGRVLRVELRNNGRPCYRVRVLVDGERVRSVAVDARSGRVRR